MEFKSPPQFMAQLEHPLKREIEEVRMIILSTDDGVTEHIKWKAPSFFCNNLASRTGMIWI